MDNETDAAEAAASTCDGFLDGRIRALQPRSGPRAAIDALFLAASVPLSADARARVLEAGAGSGVASLALAARVPGVSVTGVEIQPELCALARRNVTLNGMDGRIAVVEADVTAPSGVLRASGLEPEHFDHTAANPPFLRIPEARVSPDRTTATAYAADAGALEKWVRFLAAMTARNGTASMIHRADALDRLLEILGKDFGGLTVFPLYPREGEPARRIIVQGTKGSRAPLVLARGLVLHQPDGRFTKQAEAVLREGAGLTIRPRK